MARCPWPYRDHLSFAELAEREELRALRRARGLTNREEGRLRHLDRRHRNAVRASYGPPRAAEGVRA